MCVVVLALPLLLFTFFLLLLLLLPLLPAFRAAAVQLIKKRPASEGGEGGIMGGGAYRSTHHRGLRVLSTHIAVLLRVLHGCPLSYSTGIVHRAYLCLYMIPGIYLALRPHAPRAFLQIEYQVHFNIGCASPAEVHPQFNHSCAVIRGTILGHVYLPYYPQYV